MARRANKEGTIFQQKQKRKDGTEYTRWCCEVITGYEAGKKIVKRVYGDSKPEVLVKKTELLNAQQLNQLPKTSSITLNTYIAHWLKLKENKVKTLTYQSYVTAHKNHIEKEIGTHKIQKITTIQLNNYFSQKQKSGLAASSVKRLKAVISNILNSAQQEGIIQVNPCNNTHAITKVHQKEINVLSKDDMRLLLAKAKEWHQEYKLKFRQSMYYIILLALASGARRGELLALHWKNIDFKNNTISIKHNLIEARELGLQLETPKTKNSKRTIAISESVMNELKEYKERTHVWEYKKNILTCEWVFHTNTGKPLSPRNVGEGFSDLIKYAGLAGYSLHDLRHTHATQLISQGMSIKQVSIRLGHDDIRTTLNIYAHALPQQDRESADLMGDMLLG